MDFTTLSGCIYAEDASGKRIAEITFPTVRPGVVDIDHTFVDNSLRGQGVADQLMRAALTEIRADGNRVVATCPYAAAWFEKHPEQADILAD
ncbi:GNAT family N-acetyltransferase [Agathobaculum sp. NTUH-O15-33]|uniref:GNAT family N-acetyltransferase n=1 Tax=Agathobaculum sp. NTUH-O15-33 TaxID=3079302 RepID=UPI002958AD11|nr:GNAT family N-acetyltransferase [Agathobaculum sp. NTUH-O15-33]WNX84234.1 GNAT family N-acetyltransferase [Agathobaculum sp. NTUH-O15-33]